MKKKSAPGPTALDELREEILYILSWLSQFELEDWQAIISIVGFVVFLLACLFVPAFAEAVGYVSNAIYQYLFWEGG